TRIEPRDTVFTRMPCGTNSSAQRSVSKISAALAAPYWPDIASCGDQPEIDATLITAALGRPFMCGRARRIIRMVWITFRSSAPRQSSSVLSAMCAPPPATADIVDQDVDAAISRDRGLDQPASLFGIPDIAGVSRNFGAGRAQSRFRFAQLLGRAFDIPRRQTLWRWPDRCRGW